MRELFAIAADYVRSAGARDQEEFDALIDAFCIGVIAGRVGDVCVREMLAVGDEFEGGGPEFARRVRDALCGAGDLTN